jgi:hypothetical protein
MNEAIDSAIKAIVRKIESGGSADDAMKYAQACLNLAHVKQVVKNVNT